METLKYVIKRLLLAVIILLGVSVIIYGLARMMPTDFIDQKYSSAVSQGTMKQADVDRIKELYGLNLPDAYLTITVNGIEGYEGQKFTLNAKQDTYEDEVKFGAKKYMEWYTDGSTAIYSGNNNLSIILGMEKNDDKVGSFILGKVYMRGEVPPKYDENGNEIKDDDSFIQLNTEIVPEITGTFTLDETEGMSHDQIRQLIITLDEKYGGSVTTLSMNFRLATSGDKAKAIFKGYFDWLGNMLKGDFGMSFKYSQPVADVILQNMGISFAIAFIATILQFLIAIPLGIKAATKQYGVVDYTVTIFAMIGISLPTFFLSAIVIRIFAVGLGWFDVGGIASASMPVDASWITRLGDNLWHMVLPMFVMVVLSIGSLMRYTRTNTLEALNADYVRTARAKGLSERTVIYKHAFRNTMIPLVTLMAGILPSLFSGAMITETVFSIPGIGKKAYDALLVADVPFIMGYNMFMAVLTVIGTLLSDLMYAVVDPRVKLGK